MPTALGVSLAFAPAGVRPSFVVLWECQGHLSARWLLLRRAGGKPEGPLHGDLALEIWHKAGIGLYATHNLRIFFTFL